MLNFALCDDNPNILEKLQAMLESIFIKDNLNAEIKFATVKANELLDYVENNNVDVLFLDIQLKNQMSRNRSR